MATRATQPDDGEQRSDGGGGGGGGSGQDASAVGMALPRKRSKVQKGDGLWLMSFSDMSLIMMSFFILQLAFSTPDKRKYENVAAALDVQKGKQPADNLRTIESKIKQVVKDKKLDSVVAVKSDIKGLAIEFKDTLMFETGAAETKLENRQLLDGVLSLIAKTPGDYNLIIEGHTDEVRVNTSKFKSNWDLAAQRSMSIVELFKQRGVPEKRMTLVSYAHTRPRAAVKGLSGEALSKARAMNRRVVIRIE